MRKVVVLGVGMTKFHKPGQMDYVPLGVEAAKAALADAGVDYAKVEAAYVGYVYGESTQGQRVLYEVGLSGVPVYNVNNNCATGSSALHLGYQAVAGGAAECVLALGFEKMEKGSLGMKWGDRTLPLDKHFLMMSNARGFAQAPPAPQMFGNAAREHMERYGTTKEQLAKISVKNRKHAVHNERSQFREEVSLEQVLASTPIHEPLTKFQCCPTTDGGAAAVLCSEEFAKKLGRQGDVWIAGIAMTTDSPKLFAEPPSMLEMCGVDMTKRAAAKVYAQAGLGPKDVQVVELHDCFTSNELATYEGLGLCDEGKGGQLIDDQQVTYGGQWVVNPSGGLISKGHPLGATGLAQIFELTEQLRGRAGKRQVEGAKVALQHNLGLGGACVVTMLRKN